MNDDTDKKFFDFQLAQHLLMEARRKELGLDSQDWIDDWIAFEGDGEDITDDDVDFLADIGRLIDIPDATDSDSIKVYYSDGSIEERYENPSIGEFDFPVLKFIIDNKDIDIKSGGISPEEFKNIIDFFKETNMSNLGNYVDNINVDENAISVYNDLIERVKR